MIDRYENIRKALAMGPTPGPYRQSEHTPQRVDTGDGAISIGWACNVDNGARESRAEATAALISACDPDTLRALLAERDALATALEAAREDAARYRWLRERWGRIAETYDDDRLVFIGDGDAGEGWDTVPDSLDAAIDAAIARETVDAP